MKPQTLRAIESYWASSLGCRVEELRAPGSLVIPHGAALSEYHGVYVVRRGPSHVVSAPRCLCDEASAFMADREPDAVFDPQFLAELLGDAVERIIGPAWLGYVESDGFRPADVGGVRLLGDDDDPALRRLAAACGEEDWAYSGVRIGKPPVFGRFAEGELMAAGAPIERGQGLLDVGIVTHPAQRGKGHGRAVASAVTAHGLQRQPFMQYQTLHANAPALTIALSLGYEHLISTLSARLKGRC